MTQALIIAFVLLALLLGAFALHSRCPAEAVAPLVPRIGEALGDSAALSRLAVEAGSRLFVCAVHEHARHTAKPAPPPRRFRRRRSK